MNINSNKYIKHEKNVDGGYTVILKCEERYLVIGYAANKTELEWLKKSIAGLVEAIIKDFKSGSIAARDGFLSELGLWSDFVSYCERTGRTVKAPAETDG